MGTILKARASGNFLILYWKISFKMIGKMKNSDILDWKSNIILKRERAKRGSGKFSILFWKNWFENRDKFQIILDKTRKFLTRASEASERKFLLIAYFLIKMMQIQEILLVFKLGRKNLFKESQPDSTRHFS